MRCSRRRVSSRAGFAVASTGYRELDVHRGIFTAARLSSLDGLRAISIALVIVGHLSGTTGFGYRDFGIGDYAHLGVVVFFVISGFLITSLLMSEHDANGCVSLKLFYARRFLRIFPASYTYLTVVSLLSLWGMIHLKAPDLWHAFTYTVNYQSGRSWQIGHLWSLSVEEQFYLLWPFAFVALGTRRATWAAVGVIFLAIFARAVNRLFFVGTPYFDLEMFPMVADSLAVGCLLARLRGWLEGQRWYARLLQPGPSLLLLGLIFLLNRYQAYTVVNVFGMTLVNLAIAVLIHRSIYHSNDRMGWFLNWKPVAFVGVLSYSLYLWQQLFLNRYSASWMNVFPQNLVLAVAASLVSYFIIERPLLGLRHRLRVQSLARHSPVCANVVQLKVEREVRPSEAPDTVTLPID